MRESARIKVTGARVTALMALSTMSCSRQREIEFANDSAQRLLLLSIIRYLQTIISRLVKVVSRGVPRVFKNKTKHTLATAPRCFVVFDCLAFRNVESTDATEDSGQPVRIFDFS